MSLPIEEWVDGELVSTVDPVTGEPVAPRYDALPVEPTAEDRLATLLAALSDAQSLEEIRDAAVAAGGQ